MTETKPFDRNRVTRVTDAKGRVLGIRRPGILQRMRLFELVGADNARNLPYLDFAALAAAVVEIDGEVIEPVATKLQLEARIVLLGEEGMDAVHRAITAGRDDVLAASRESAILATSA